MKKHIIAFLSVLFFSCNVQKNSKIDYEVTKGETFDVALIANPSTGYSWKWIKNKNKNLVDSISSNFIQDDAAEGMVGVGGKEIWKFKGKQHGINTLTFEYCRSWNPNSTVQIKKIVVKIK
jgi:inhibitor of cysteine peptidase